MSLLVQTRYGRMLVNEKDTFVGKSLIEYGEFSAEEANLFSQIIKPGWCVIDVGANIGAHTLLFSKLVGLDGRVYAFEPQRLIFQMLCANMALNNILNVFCEQSALGEKEKIVFVGDVDPDIEQNFGGTALADLCNVVVGDPVTIRPLDIPCHFIKIDVEGMEAEVLRGARKIIDKFKPLLYVENDRVEKGEELILLVESLGYTPFWHCAPLFQESNFNNNSVNVFGNIGSQNMFCIPEGKNIRHGLTKASVNDVPAEHRKQTA